MLQNLVRTVGGIGLGLCFLLSGVSSAQEATKTGGSIHYNNSRRIRYYSWATVDYTVNNPTDKPVDVNIRFTPLNQRNITVYENSFSVGAGLRYQYHMPVTIGTVDQYAIDMFLNRTRVTDANQRLTVIRLAQKDNHFIVFVNDDIDLSYGLFSKNENLDGNYVNTLNRTSKAATHFSGYDNAHIVVLYRPNFTRMTSRQYNALLDHVARGGTLVFGDPQGAAAAWNTPLRKCMPVTPLRLRQVEHLDALEAIGGVPVFWPEGAQFLESVPRGNGVSTLTHEDFPLVRWGSYGLGRVGVCAVNPSLDRFRNEHNGRNFDAYWRHLLAFGGRVSYASSSRDPGLTEAVDKLTGIEIPDRSLIRNIVLCYMAVIIVFIGIGLFLRQHVKSWIGLGVIALAATWGVFIYAGIRQSNLEPKTATMLEFVNHGVEDLCTEQLVSLTLLSESTLDLNNDDVDLLLRSFPPPRRVRRVSNHPAKRPTAARQSRRARKRGPGKKGKKGKKGKMGKNGGKKAEKRKMFGEAEHGEDEDLRDPLKITRSDGRSSLKHLRLRNAKPQFYSALHTRDGAAMGDFPIVRWTPAGPVIEPWELPAEIGPAEAAILICENGYYALDRSSTRISLKGKGGAVRGGPEYRALAEFLERKATPTPAIVVFTELATDSTGYLAPEHADKDHRFHITGRRVHLIPVVDRFDTETVNLPFARIRTEILDRTARSLVMYGQWQPVRPTGKTDGSSYPITCFLPPAANHLLLNRVNVDFRAENRGGNIAFRVFVRAKGRKADAIELQLQKDGTYAAMLTPEQSAALIDRSNGGFEVVLQARPKIYLKDHIQRLRQNTWKVKQLRVGAEGTLPPERRGRL